MAYPSLEQYNEALQAPQRTLLDQELKGGSIKTSGLGLPLALCGGFALTYTVTAGGKKWALRCFHKESRELESRYQAISARLKQLNSPYFVPFEFNPNGIRIQGNTYPIVKMEWAKGRTLAEFLEAEHRNVAALKNLRTSLASLAAFLEQNQIAHGDIQPENVMVAGNGNELQLIDYDGLYVSAFHGASATELGQINFQHPKRSATYFNHHLDRFSFLTLDVALQALIASPSIWASSRSEPSAVVFRRTDFDDPAASVVFQEAVAIPGIKAHVTNLAKVAAGEFSAIPTLSEFLQGRGVPAGPIALRPRTATPLVYQGAYPVCDATKFAQVAPFVGSRVELVGQVHSVRKAWAVNRKPYVFVNFSDWRGHAVKLAIWVDGMDAIKPNVPDDSWKGQWIAVTGLVDPPFTKQSQSGSYTHLSITISAAGQIQKLTEKEARFRLGGVGRTGAIAPPTSSLGNADILRGMGAGSAVANGRTKPPVPLPAPSPPKSRNQQLVSGMQRQTPTNVSSQTPSRGAGGSPQPAGSSPSSNSGCLPLIIGGLGFLFLIRLFAG